MAEKVKGKVLNLIIKQKYFDEIIAGTKKQEFREVKPSTVKKLVQLDEDGYEATDEYGNALPVKYDYLRLFVGYNKDRDTALVEVKDAHSEIFTEVVMVEADENGVPILYALDKQGNYVTDEDGNFVKDPDGVPYVVEEGGVEFERPITYDYGIDKKTGEQIIWVAEQIVFDLGKVVECKRKGVHEV